MMTLNTLSNFAGRAASLVAAMGMTTFLFVSYFSAPSAQIVQGMIA